MRVIVFFLFIISILSCSKDDVTIPQITFKENTQKAIKGQPYSIDYVIEDENIDSSKLELLDGNNDVISTKDVSGSGTFSFTITEDATPPLVVKITATDKAGNIGVGSQVIDMLSLELTFKIKYNGEDLKYLETYEYPTGNPVQFSKVSFYVSDLKLDDKLVEEIDLVKIPTASTNVDSVGYHLLSTNVTPGEYSKISFNIGVPVDLNAKAPNDFSSDNPLSLAAEYWSNWNSYIFSKIEGKYDNDDNIDFEVPFALHTGIDDALMSFSFEKEIILSQEENGKVTVVLDLYEVFNNDGDIFDVVAHPQLHAPAQLPYMLDLSERIQKFLKLEE